MAQNDDFDGPISAFVPIVDYPHITSLFLRPHSRRT
jgi:hypothetical protein